MKRTMLTALFAMGAVVAAIPPASAQNLEAIKARKELLKEFGKLTKAPGGMLKQEVPFDLAAVKAALAKYQESAPKIAALFPDDSKTGGETEALPAIWENKDDVAKRFEKLAADAKAAEAKITDEFSFMDEFPKVVGNCGGCHKKYRQDK
ncbi:MAG: cytochrome c [Hyphomicrobiaceae bacterium]|nr:cytochrome c [Hyphomicrobiaceae bacterium]